MRGASRASLAAAKERLAAALSADTSATSAQAASLGDELFAIAGLLDREPSVRRNLSDPTIGGSFRAGLARDLLGHLVSGEALDQFTGVAEGRWSEPADLVDATEQLAVLAICAGADTDGLLDEVEDELFRFARIVGGNPDLRYALANQFVPAEARRGIVTDLLEGKVAGPTLRLISQAAAFPRGRSLDSSLEEYAGLAADLRQRLVAEVHVAAELTTRQRSRLVAALTAAYGHDVHLNVVLDPEIVGGMTVRIGDELINGSVESRLAAVRRDLAA
jgi:F-type H+-transporting ATPase subunit delta